VFAMEHAPQLMVYVESTRLNATGRCHVSVVVRPPPEQLIQLGDEDVHRCARVTTDQVPYCPYEGNESLLARVMISFLPNFRMSCPKKPNPSLICVIFVFPVRTETTRF